MAREDQTGTKRLVVYVVGQGFAGKGSGEFASLSGGEAARVYAASVFLFLDAFALDS